MSYTNFVSRIIFPAHEWLKRHDTVAVRERLERSQWWTPQDIRTYQEQRLGEFLRATSLEVPYYQVLFEEMGLNVADIQTVSDLSKIPFLSKSIVRANHDKLIAKNAGPLKRLNTGGSTGEPMVFQVGRSRISHDVAAKWRATRWWDVDIGDKEIVVWGSPIEVSSQDRIKLLRDKLLRTELFSAFEMSQAMIDRIIDAVRRKRPSMLFGYPSALNLIADRAANRGLSAPDFGVHVAFVTAEKCYPYQRDMIESVFGCRVANGYGGRDAGFVAHTCQSDSLHYCAEDIVVEIVDKAGRPAADGETGEIVVTHMATNDFPFIRYRTGDLATASVESCPCGRGLPVLRDISGRSTDFVQAADGTLMHGLALIYVLRDLAGIETFKIIQRTADNIVVRVVSEEGFNDKTIKDIKSGFAKRLGRGIRVDVEEVNHIAPEPSGKYRYVVNKIAENLDGGVIE